MFLLLFIPLGLLCLVLAVLALRVGRKKHALVCAVLVVFFWGSAALMGYGTGVLLQSLS